MKSGSLTANMRTMDESRGKAPISFFLTTKDEEENLPFALQSIVGWCEEVFVLDSGSTDRTGEIAESYGAKFFYTPWKGYAGQKNWGLDNLPFTGKWIFILDADEVITPELRDELIRIANDDNCPNDACFVNRYFIFLGKRIRHCGYYPSWNCRFFKRGKARYEQREVHEHMIVNGPTAYLKHEMEHYDRRGIEFYIHKHNRYSTLEAGEMFKVRTGTSKEAPASFWGGPQQRRRWIKHTVWPRLPARWFFRWLYMYIFRLGILDGKIGFHFCLFLAGYEHQISLKLKELQTQAKRPKAAPPQAQAMPAGEPGAAQ